MSYDIDSVVNVGIAFAWREHLYYNYKPSNILGKAFKSVIYKILSVFVTDVPNYYFNDDILNLNLHLKDNFIYFWMMYAFSL